MAMGLRAHAEASGDADAAQVISRDLPCDLPRSPRDLHYLSLRQGMIDAYYRASRPEESS